MPFLFIYLLKLSVSLAVVFTFYHFVLRKLTFYNWNRWYLLGYSLLSFFIPFIDISQVLQRNEWTENSIVQWVPVIQQPAIGNHENGAVSDMSGWNIACLLIIVGMVIMLTRLLIQFISYHRLLRKAEPLAIGLIPGSGMKLYQVEGNIIPFSFGNSIFINHHLHTKEELQEIVWHEFIHVKQKHSLDIICGELLCLLNWYNPFAWLLRRSIRQNLEFIADNKVLENGVDRKEYQYLLLKVIGNDHFSIAPKFNFSSLKKRIAMMNKLQSAKVHLVKFLFVLPVAIVMLLAFRNKERISQTPGSTGSMLHDTIPARKTMMDIKLPEAILSIGMIDNNEDAAITDPVKQKVHGLVLVKRKDGGKEVYDLDKKEDKDAFEKKYAAKLEDIIPPPPPPPVPVIDMTPVVPASPDRPVQVITSDTAPARTKGDDINLKGISSEYEITDKKAVIKLKDGTVEKYDLTNKKERSAFEKKYGKIINVNTNINSNANVNVNTNVNASVDVAPVAVTVNGKTMTSTIAPVTVNGKLMTSTVAPVTVTGIHSATATTVVAPVAISGKLSAVSVTPSPIRSVVAGTTVIAPLAATEGVTIVDDYGYTITGNEDILVTITKNTTRQQLDDFIKQMKAKDIELTYDNIEYNSKGQLTVLSGTMKSKDGHSNFVASDFETLILAMIRKGEKTWFKVSVKDKEVI